MAFFLFLVSLLIFLATIMGFAWRLTEISTWNRGGRGEDFAIVVELFLLWMATVLGLGISFILCCFSIPNFKRAIILLLIEPVAFVWLFYATIAVFRPMP